MDTTCSKSDGLFSISLFLFFSFLLTSSDYHLTPRISFLAVIMAYIYPLLCCFNVVDMGRLVYFLY